MVEIADTGNAPLAAEALEVVPADILTVGQIRADCTVVILEQKVRNTVAVEVAKSENMRRTVETLDLLPCSHAGSFIKLPDADRFTVRKVNIGIILAVAGLAAAENRPAVAEIRNIFHGYTLILLNKSHLKFADIMQHQDVRTPVGIIVIRSQIFGQIYILALKPQCIAVDSIDGKAGETVETACDKVTAGCQLFRRTDRDRRLVHAGNTDIQSSRSHIVSADFNRNRSCRSKESGIQGKRCSGNGDLLHREVTGYGHIGIDNLRDIEIIYIVQCCCIRRRIRGTEVQSPASVNRRLLFAASVNIAGNRSAGNGHSDIAVDYGSNIHIFRINIICISTAIDIAGNSTAADIDGDISCYSAARTFETFVICRPRVCKSAPVNFTDRTAGDIDLDRTVYGSIASAAVAIGGKVCDISQTAAVNIIRTAAGDIDSYQCIIRRSSIFTADRRGMEVVGPAASVKLADRTVFQVYGGTADCGQGSGSIAGSHTAAEDFRYGGRCAVNRNIR